MSATTSFFFCGKCGFENHPRLNQDNSKCEQCGEDRSHEDATDYKPTSSR